MSRQTLKDSPLFATCVEVVETRLRKGAIRMERGPSARYEWGGLGLTIRQRDAAIEELIRRGVAKPVVGAVGGGLWINAVTPG
jgi:hypothetical protein